MKRAMPIEWHEEGLSNMKKTLENYSRQLDELSQRVESLQSNIDFLESQISEAKKRKKSSFDADKFMRKTA